MRIMSESSQDLVRQLPTSERRILVQLQTGTGSASLNVVASQAGFPNEDVAFSAASWLQKKGLVEISERKTSHVTVGREGEAFLRDGFPEVQVHRVVAKAPQGASLVQLRNAFAEQILSIALAWWKRKGLGTIEKRGSETFLNANPTLPEAADERLLSYLFQEAKAGHDPAGTPEEQARARNPNAYDWLKSRPGLLLVHEHKQRFLQLTALGRQVHVDPASIDAGLAELTPELIKSGAWKGKELRPYDVSTPVPRTLAGKPHPLVQIIDEVREIFLQMGFEEIEEDFVQSAFWNMDALFIPQDHPAREMQDTFYLETPAELPVDERLIKRISEVHESGGRTGSRGWGTPLDPRESRRALLRTHTTVGTIRYLADHPEGPTRVFSIGRVFRKETMDATHLPEFHQIEGIATEEGADFRMLLGILQEFYRRLGYEKLRWRPSYFPYTEPSMEVEVWTGEKWLELGGCGIFRPEVTRPFGVKTPVLAWGLGLERLAMIRLGLGDIRNLFVSDLEWLRSQPLL